MGGVPTRAPAGYRFLPGSTEGQEGTKRYASVLTREAVRT